MRSVLRHFSPLLAGMLLAAQAMATTQAGFRRIEVPAPTQGGAPITVALYYPTQAPARSITMGPFTAMVAMSARPDDRVKGLILLSHGTGGTESGHGSLAEALARQGYLVAALRHPGDNWQDRSLLKTTAERFFAERPRQASQVISALLNDPEWKPRIATDAKGPRVGAVGHSAGGYTVLALAGARPDASRIATHCRDHQVDDPIFCALANTAHAAGGPLPTAATEAVLADPRVRAIVAMAPLGVVFGPGSLADVRVPVAIYSAEKDRFLVPRFHADWIAQQLPQASLQRVANAWHFAFMDTPGMAIATEDGDVAADPPGFQRQIFLRRLQRDIPAFFDQALD